jgi:cell division protein FtsZ
MAAPVNAEVVDPEAEKIFGTATEPDHRDQVQITNKATGFAARESYHQRMEEDVELRRMRNEAMENRDDTDLPTFLRRPVSLR